MPSPTALDPPEVENYGVTPINDQYARVQAVVDGRLMAADVPVALAADPVAAVAYLISHAREQARLRAASPRGPARLPTVPDCTGCGKAVNPTTGECAGCSD